eukprot:Gb_04512 [translate_table: standard]
MTTLLHTLPYALNPIFYHKDILSIRKSPNKDKEVLDGLIYHGYNKAFKKLYPNAKVAYDVKIEFSELAFSQNSYADIDALQDKKSMSLVN